MRISKRYIQLHLIFTASVSEAFTDLNMFDNYANIIMEAWTLVYIINTCIMYLVCVSVSFLCLTSLLTPI